MKALTYSNVAATIAVFIALGGTSYAALSITGKDVRNRSLTGADVKKNSLTGRQIAESKLGRVRRAARADRASGADRATTAQTATRANSAANADKLGGHAAGEFVAAERFYNSGIVKLALGQSRTLFRRGPLSVTFKCYKGGSDRIADLVATSTMGGELVPNGTGDKPLAKNTELSIGKAFKADAPALKAVGSYFDSPTGDVVEVSGRLRVLRFGTDCSAIVSATAYR